MVKGTKNTNATAEVEKELGNEAYKKRDFVTARRHYDKAIELNPLNMTYYTNKAAVLLEEGEYSESVNVCLEAIDIGRSNKADSNQFAKAYARIGNAYSKQNKIKDAVKYYEKSLAESDDATVRKRLNELKETTSTDSKKSDKEKGDEAYRNGEYVVAIKHYNDAIKKNPDDAKAYGNRAQCFLKLQEYQLAAADADLSVEKDPKFAKGYVRKGYACLETKQYARAAIAFENALKLDSSKEALGGYDLACTGFYDNPVEIRKRALEDPQIRELLSEPDLRLLVEQLIDNPADTRKYLKEGDYDDRLEKLIAAGVLRIC